MGMLDKGAKYTANGLDFTLIQKDYKVVGRIHYVRAQCNICGKKVDLHQGAWYNGTIGSCPSCIKNKDKKETPVSSDKPKAKPKITPKSTSDQSAESKNNGPITIGSRVGSSVVKGMDGNALRLQCTKCGNMTTLSRSIISDRLKANQPLCNCENLEKIDIGIIKEIDNTEKAGEKPLREVPGWIFMRSFMVTEKTTRYEYQCATCGRLKQFTVGEILNKKCSCDMCKKIEKHKITPLVNLDWVGYTTKCRRIESIYTDKRDIKIAKIKCLICGEEEELALVSVTTDSIQVCRKCANKQIVMNCPICGKNHLKNNLKGLYSDINSDIICINENKIIPKEELLETHDSKIRIQYIQSKYRGRYKFKKKIDAGGDKGTLFIFDSGYTGTDGKQYDNCMCIQHNRFLTLTEEEQSTYRHEYCTDIRMIPYKNKGNIK